MRAFALVAVIAGAALLPLARPAAAQETPANEKESHYECPGCLRQVPPDAERCPECGLSFKKLEYECPKCHTTVPWDATVCPKCGQVFAPPSPGEKEKRNALPRSMPAKPDFLKNPPVTDEQPGIEVHGNSLSLFRMGRETSFNGTTTILRGVEDLNFVISHIGMPELSFHGSIELIGDRNLRPMKSYDGFIREAFLRYESLDAKTQVNLGRQYVDSGVTREFVDALFVHHVFGDRLGVEAFGGHPVSTGKEDPAGDFEGGIRVFWRGLPGTSGDLFRDLTIGVSFREEFWDSRIVRQDLGVDFVFSPTWEVDLSGHAYWSFVTRGFYDARGTFEWRPLSWLEVTLDYRYIVPSALLPASSIFSAFADDLRHEFEADLDLWPLERLKIRGWVRGYYIPNNAFTSNGLLTGGNRVPLSPGREVPYEIGTGFAYTHGASKWGTFGMEVSLLDKGGLQRYAGATVYEASVLQYRIYEMVAVDVADKHTLKGSIDLHIEANDGKLYRRQNSAGQLTLTAGYMYDHKYAFTIGGDYRSTPDFRNTYDVFAKLEVPF